MIKNLLVGFSIFFFFSFAALGQSRLQAKNSSKKAAKGTYQFIVTNSKSDVTFSEEILSEVEKNRLDNEVKFLQLGDQVKVKILPRSEINSPSFVPIKEEIIYLNEK